MEAPSLSTLLGHVDASIEQRSALVTALRAKLGVNESGSGEARTTCSGAMVPGQAIPTDDSFADAMAQLDRGLDARQKLIGALRSQLSRHAAYPKAHAEQTNVVSRERVVPLYGRGAGDASGATGGAQQDPRDRVPPRPAGQRSEPESAVGAGAGGLFGAGADGQGFHMSFGIGAFPFGLFASSFNIGGDGSFFGQTGAAGAAGAAGAPDAATGESMATSEDDTFLAKLFLYVAILFVFCLIIA